MLNNAIIKGIIERKRIVWNVGYIDTLSANKTRKPPVFLTRAVTVYARLPPSCQAVSHDRGFGS
jgi:hypothetical protein